MLVKTGGYVFYEKLSFKIIKWSLFSSWGSVFLKKIGASIWSVSLLSSEVAFDLYKSSIQPCVEYIFHLSACMLQMFTWICWIR